MNSNSNPTNPLNAQGNNGPLKITVQEEGSNDLLVWYFPSGSAFTVLNVNDEQVDPSQTFEDHLEFTGEMTLVVNPSNDLDKEDVLKYKNKIVKVYPGTVNEKIYVRE